MRRGTFNKGQGENRKRTKAGQPLLLLLLSTVGVDGVHDQRGLDTHGRAVTTVNSITTKQVVGIKKINCGVSSGRTRK